MSEWTPLAVGRGWLRRRWEDAATDFSGFLGRSLHILQQDNNAPYGSSYYSLYLDANVGTTARFHIYPEPTYFGNSRPNLLSVALTNEYPYQPQGSVNLYCTRGTVRLMLCRNPERTEGVWVELSQDVIGHSWQIRDPNAATRISVPGWANYNLIQSRAYGSVADGVFSAPLPSAMMAYGFSMNRLVRFGVIGSAAIGEYSLNNFGGYQWAGGSVDGSGMPHIPFGIAVVQRDGASTATVAVGDMSDLSWHYVFDSGMSFVPAGDCLPQTYAAVEIYAPPNIENYPQSGRTLFTESPRPRCSNLWMASVGRSERQSHNGHFPTSGVVFGRDDYVPPFYKPANGAVPSESRAVAFGATGYTTQREQFELGLAAIPSLPSVGHWTALPTTGPTNGNMSLTLRLNTESNLYYHEGHSWSLSGAIGYTLTLGKTDVAGVPLTHNCAHAQVSGINRDSTSFRYGMGRGAPSSLIGSPEWLESYDTSYFNPAAPGLYMFTPPYSASATIICNAEATLAAWQAAVNEYAQTFSIVSPSGGGYSVYRNFYYTAFEEYSTLRDMQGFSRMHYGKGAAPGYGPYMESDVTAIYGYYSEIMPAGPVESAHATSGNADAWASGVPAPVKVSKRRIMIDALLRVVGLRRWRNVKVFTPRWVVDTPTQLKLDGWLEIPRPDLEGVTLSEWQEFLSAHYLFSEAASDSLRSGAVATVPAGVLKSVLGSEFSGHYTMLEKLSGYPSDLELEVSIA